MLEEDALRFDAFLKENDEKVQEAIKKAEVEAKAKQDKVCSSRSHSVKGWGKHKLSAKLKPCPVHGYPSSVTAAGLVHISQGTRQ